ncbi:MAG: sugar transferase [Bacteroidales bacterium]|nr:sugar transferase [Bacteroidales bacterium]
MLIRFFDIIFSLVGLILFIPFFLIISTIIIFDNYGNVFFLQKRVGKNNVDFTLYKFRTMIVNSDRKGLLTVGAKDNRITKIGYYLRKYKIDELPQLVNVLIGNMSFVGPRPEVRKYVDLYDEEQKIILTVKPGITDYASLEYSKENEILALSNNPEKTYIEEIMPNKINLNMKYINNPTTSRYFKIIFFTIKQIL